MKQHTAAMLPYVFCASLVLAQSNSVELVGKLAADGGSIAGATVQAVLLTAEVGKDGPAIWRTQSDTTGNFRFDSLTPGAYRLCVTDAGDWLDPCQWTPANVVPVRAGGSNSVEVRLQRGVRVAIAALDPDGHSKGRTSEMAPPLAVSAIEGTGQTRVVPLTASGPGPFLYTLLLPAGINIDFKISSRLFAIGDGRGNRVDSQNYRVPVRAQRLQRPVAANYTGNIFRFAPQYDVVVPVRILGVAGAP